ncbi:hypothetical protein [Dialister micraerophilus]|uniref:hypothetical protein n=1 Tax=Dialister micraerophilus TaxID=309120 RepID=UPI0023F0B4AE|nr:hypothetical protein [Dialister micraerophilus]
MDQLQTYEDFITNYVDVANEDILLDLNNDYASNHMYEEYIRIFDNDEDFFDVYFQNQEEIERAKEYGEYHWKDKYVTLDEENNIYSYESLSEALEEKFNRQAVIDYMVESKYLRDEYIDYLNEEISCFNKKELMETFYTNQNPDILNVVSEDLMYMIKYNNESDNQFTFKELEDLFNKTELRAKTLKKSGRESDENFNLQYEIKEEIRYKIEELNYIEAKELINNFKNPRLKRIIAKEKYNLENFYEIYDTVEEKNNEYIFKNLESIERENEAYEKGIESEKLISEIHIPITPEDEADAKKNFKNFTGQDIDLPENKPKQGKIYDPEVKRTIELNAHFLNLKQDYIVNKFLNREKEREATLTKSEQTKEKPKLNLSKPREGRGRER